MSHSESDRRRFLRQLGVAGAGLALAAPLARAAAGVAPAPLPTRRPTGPDDALRRLMDGNARFARGEVEAPHRNLARLREVEAKQTPFAAFLGCADSRVPIEIVFDQGFGDLFPVRVAGNIVTPEVIGSLEFGCAVLGAQVLMVLGHTHCGAVKATVEGGAVPGQISSLYYHIEPAAEAAKGDAEVAVVQNVRNQARLLARSSPVLAAAVQAGTLVITGGVFDLASGRVTLISP
jgi:carbonic anhydrase